MAVATETLALAQHASWTRSASDQAAATACADVRIDTPAALAPGSAGTITNAGGITRAMAVSVQQQALPGELLAIDAAQAPGTVLLRGDQSALPLTPTSPLRRPPRCAARPRAPSWRTPAPRR